MQAVYTFEKLAALLGQMPVLSISGLELNQVLYDSRKLIQAEGVVFFALKSDKSNGHDYIPELLERGVQNFVVSERRAELEQANVNYVLVPDTLEALQLWAAKHRKGFEGQVVGIAGSNGKTIVKEWLSQLLAAEYMLVKSPSSFNSQLGVPISVLKIKQEHDLALIEAGISKPGEMPKLEAIVRPDIGIFTNLGSAHGAYFANDRDKLLEKLQLFQAAKCLIYSTDNKLVQDTVLEWSADKKLQLLSWSEQQQDVWMHVSVKGLSNGNKQITADVKEQTYSIEIPFADKASVQNAIHCLAVCIYLQRDLTKLQSLFKELTPVQMRLEQKAAIYRSTVINDSYSADLDSLANALSYLRTQQQNSRTVLVLSDMLESGLSANKLYQQIAALAARSNVNLFVGIGPEMIAHKGLFTGSTHFYPSTEAFLNSIHIQDYSDAAILIKGARSFHFEDIVSYFEVQKHGTVLEVHLDAVAYNLQYYRSQLKPECKVMAMVKALAYGSGAHEIAAFLQHKKVDYLAVAYVDEGLELRRKGIQLPIMVMNPEEAGFAQMIEYKLEPELYSLSIFESFQKAMLMAGVEHYPVHIKVETGMHRLGWEESQIDTLLEKIRQSKMQLISVFSHLSSSENAQHDAFTRQQIATFERIASKLQSGLGYSIMKHILNSAGITRFPEAHFDMVRLGIGLYGVSSIADEQKALHEVAVFKTVVSQVKTLHAGETVGYGRAGKASEGAKIATIAVGYADGFRRVLGQGRGEVLIKGRKVPVLGNVCMDMTMVDITGLDVKEGDEVLIFGPGLSIYEYAEKMGTIPYEVLTSISPRVKRVYYYS